MVSRQLQQCLANRRGRHARWWGGVRRYSTSGALKLHAVLDAVRRDLERLDAAVRTRRQFGRVSVVEKSILDAFAGIGGSRSASSRRVARIRRSGPNARVSRGLVGQVR